MNIRPTHQLLLFLAMVILVACSANNSITGVYLGKMRDSMILVQLIATPDGKISGRGEIVSVLTSGEIRNASFPLTGSVDEGQIILKVDLLLGIGKTIGGTFDENTLHLISENSSFDLTRGDLKAFEQEKQKLLQAGKAIVLESQQNKIQLEARDFQQKLESEGKSIEVTISQLPNLERGADILISQTKLKRDSLVSEIKKLIAKLPSDDGSIEYKVDNLDSDLYDLKNDLVANMNNGSTKYSSLRSELEDFKAQCEIGTSQYKLALPSQCIDYQQLSDSFVSSRTTMRTKYDDANKMFNLK